MPSPKPSWAAMRTPSLKKTHPPAPPKPLHLQASSPASCPGRGPFPSCLLQRLPQPMLLIGRPSLTGAGNETASTDRVAIADLGRRCTNCGTPQLIDARSVHQRRGGRQRSCRTDKCLLAFAEAPLIAGVGDSQRFSKQHDELGRLLNILQAAYAHVRMYIPAWHAYCD